MFHQQATFKLYKFIEDGNTESDFYNFFNNWRRGYDWTIIEENYKLTYQIPLIIFDEDLNILFHLTFKEYCNEA